jgi:hypothetical protein
VPVLYSGDVGFQKTGTLRNLALCELFLFAQFKEAVTDNHVCDALSTRQTAMLTCSATMFLYQARFANQTAFVLAIF